jgi:putative hydrolase of the HAD superfamily
MIRAVIFDLDCCLSAADEVGRELYDPVFAAVRAANDGSISEETLTEAFEDAWRISWDVVAKLHGLTEKMLQAGWNEFSKTEVRQAMHGYGDLNVLPELTLMRFLVTTGFRRLQESKIDALGIRSLFTQVTVDAIDEADSRGKQPIFEEILAIYHLGPSETLIVGDNEDSEIAAGIRLGMPTVQIVRPGVTRGLKAKHVIESLGELKLLLGEVDLSVETHR